MLQRDYGERKYLCLTYEPVHAYCEACGIEKGMYDDRGKKVERESV